MDLPSFRLGSPIQAIYLWSWNWNLYVLVIFTSENFIPLFNYTSYYMYHLKV